MEGERRERGGRERGEGRKVGEGERRRREWMVGKEGGREGELVRKMV